MKCIYAIVHRDTGRRYVGSTLHSEDRFADHWFKLEHNCHHSRYLQRAFNKYGRDAFEIRILQEFDDITKEQIQAIEQSYIDELQPEDFNASRDARTPQRRGPHTPESRQKISEGQKRRHMEHPVTVESRQKMSESHKGQRHSAESNERRAQKLRGRSYIDMFGPEKAAELRRRKSSSIKQAWTPEKRAQAVETQKQRRTQMTDEQLQHEKDAHAAAQKAVWDRMTDEEHALAQRKMHSWGEETREKHRTSIRASWTDERRQQHSENLKRAHASKSPEQLAEEQARRTQAVKEGWARRRAMTPEQRDEETRRRSEAQKAVMARRKAQHD
jgi:group I intron endonuclease